MAQAWEEFKAEQAILAEKAKQFRISRPPDEGESVLIHSLQGWLDTVSDVSTDIKASAAVRDSDSSIEVIIMMVKDNQAQFFPWQKEACAISFENMPSYEEGRRIARNRLRLPGIFSRRWNEKAIIEELEHRDYSLLIEWRKSEWLKEELILLFDETYSATLGGYSLKYDKENGLIYNRGE